MQVKRFEAPTMQEALEAIKRELGPEAIILQTRKNRRGFGLLSKSSVEVTAAISERAIDKKKNVEKRLPEPQKQAVRGMSATKQAEIFNRYEDKNIQKAQTTREKVEMSRNSKSITATRYVDIPEKGRVGQKEKIEEPAFGSVLSPSSSQLEKKHAIVDSGGQRIDRGSENSESIESQLQLLRQTVNDMKLGQENERDLKEERKGSAFSFPMESGSGNSSALEEAFEQLVINGVERRYALSLVKKMRSNHDGLTWNDSHQAFDYLAEEMMNTVNTLSIWKKIKSGTLNTIALIGSTGVGKTTTLAKIANEASARNLKVGLINLDHQKIGAFDQLATLAKILSVPFRSASTVGDLKAVLFDFKDFDLILLDAAGYSQRDTTSLKALHEVLVTVPALQSYLVLSATTRESELYDTVNRFSLFNASGLIISKLDEAVVYGSIYNVAQRSKLPLVYFTTGQIVPDDIEEATRERLVSLIIDID